MTVPIIDNFITVTNAQATFLKAIVAGDHNSDGIVDAADYVVWRKLGGNSTDFNYWYNNFRNQAANYNPSQPAPEPSTALLVLIGGSAFVASGRPRLARA
jgi:hypothetical protein